MADSARGSSRRVRVYFDGVLVVAKRLGIGMSPKTFIKHSGISEATMNRIENGKGVGMATAERLCAFYKTTIIDLGGRIEGDRLPAEIGEKSIAQWSSEVSESVGEVDTNSPMNRLFSAMRKFPMDYDDRRVILQMESNLEGFITRLEAAAASIQSHLDSVERGILKLYGSKDSKETLDQALAAATANQWKVEFMNLHKAHLFAIANNDPATTHEVMRLITNLVGVINSSTKRDDSLFWVPKHYSSA